MFADKEVADFVAAIEATLDVEFESNAYVIRWQDGGRHLELTAPRDMFRFYVAGDRSAVQNDRGLRAANWDAAGRLWAEIASRSGRNWPATASMGAESLGLKLALEKAPSQDLVRLLLVAIAVLMAFSVAAGFDFSKILQIAGAVIGGAALAFLSIERTGLARAPWPPFANELIIVGSAAAAALFFDSQLFLGIGLLLAAVAGLSAVEKYRPGMALAWLVAFVLASAVIFAVGRQAVSIGAIVFILIWMLIVFIMPRRFSKSIFVGGCLAVIAASMPGLTSFTSDQPVPGVTLMVIFLSGLVFACGWFLGELNALTPWLGHGFIFAGAAAAFAVSDAGAASAWVLALGFCFAESVRFASALMRSRAAPIKKPPAASA